MTTEVKPLETPLSGGPSTRAAPSLSGSFGVDYRLLGMVAALAILWFVFNLLSDGRFLTPRNLWNLSVQTAAVATMTTGMVLIIVSRNIDLSIGSVLGFTAMFMALLQVEWLPQTFGLGLSHPATWIITVAVGVLLGAVIGGLHGFVIAFLGVPSFIVTLGGLLIWRGLSWVMARGRTIAPMDVTFQLLGGGARGSAGGTISWIIAVVASIAIVLLLWSRRRRRVSYGLRVRPLWADVALMVLGPLMVFAAGGAFGALAGVVITPIVLAHWNAGLDFGLKGFIGAIIGGFRSPSMAVVGGLGIGIVEALAAGYISSGSKDVIAYGILLAYLLARGGVFARGRAALLTGSH